MSQIGTPQYLIQGPFGAYGPGWPNGPPPTISYPGGFNFQTGNIESNPFAGRNPQIGAPLPAGWDAMTAQQRANWYGPIHSGLNVSPAQPQAAQTQTPSQSQQSDQPAPRQPAQTPGPREGSYGYGSPGAYAAPPTPPLAGAPPQGPAYAPPPQPLPSASAPVAPTLIAGQPTAQAPMPMQRPTVMSTPPVNPLHAAIQSQMANNMGGGSFQVPYFADLLNKRFQGYQTP